MQRALRLLSRRERTRAELEGRLAAFAESEEELRSVLDHLVERKLLSEERFVEARVNSLARRYGAAKVKQSLQQSGADRALVDEAMTRLRATEMARARTVLRQRFGSPSQDAMERLRRRRFLQSRGFSFDIIRRVADDFESDDDEQ